MKRLVTWPKSSGPRLWMDARRPLKLPRRSTSTRLGRLSCHEKCSPLFQSYLCSSQRSLSFSRRKRKRTRYWNSACRIWIRECLRPRTATLSSIKCRGTSRGEDRKATNGSSAKRSSSRLLQMASRRMPCLALIRTCLRIFSCLGHMLCLRHSSQASQEHRCGTLRNLS